MAVANGFSFLIPARLEHARILPLQLWITCPILRIGPRSGRCDGVQPQAWALTQMRAKSPPFRLINEWGALAFNLSALGGLICAPRLREAARILFGMAQVPAIPMQRSRGWSFLFVALVLAIGEIVHIQTRLRAGLSIIVQANDGLPAERQVTALAA